jgi:hypothetical protein
MRSENEYGNVRIANNKFVQLSKQTKNHFLHANDETKPLHLKLRDMNVHNELCDAVARFAFRSLLPNGPHKITHLHLTHFSSG